MSGPTAPMHCEAALAFDPPLGISVERAMTDTGSRVRSKAVVVILRTHDVRPPRTRESTPRDHRTAERFVRTLGRESADARPHRPHHRAADRLGSVHAAPVHRERGGLGSQGPLERHDRRTRNLVDRDN